MPIKFLWAFGKGFFVEKAGYVIAEDMRSDWEHIRLFWGKDNKSADKEKVAIKNVAEAGWGTCGRNRLKQNKFI